MPSTADAKAASRKRVESEAARVLSYDTRTMATPVEWGPGRMDALSLIANRVVGVLPNIHENWTTPICTGEAPFLWNAPRIVDADGLGIVQDPIARNFGETAGVHLPIDLTSKTPAEGLFQSNAAIKELQEVEEQLARLAPPSWPEEVFGKIDRERPRRARRSSWRTAPVATSCVALSVDRAQQVRQALRPASGWRRKPDVGTDPAQTRPPAVHSSANSARFAAGLRGQGSPPSAASSRW